MAVTKCISSNVVKGQFSQRQNHGVCVPCILIVIKYDDHVWHVPSMMYRLCVVNVRFLHVHLFVVIFNQITKVGKRSNFDNMSLCAKWNVKLNVLVHSTDSILCSLGHEMALFYEICTWYQKERVTHTSCALSVEGKLSRDDEAVQTVTDLHQIGSYKELLREIHQLHPGLHFHLQAGLISNSWIF